MKDLVGSPTFTAHNVNFPSGDYIPLLNIHVLSGCGENIDTIARLNLGLQMNQMKW